MPWLVLCDLLFIGGYVAAVALQQPGIAQEILWLFDIETDRSVPEIFGFAKWAVCIGGLLLASQRQRDWALFAWAMIFVGLLYDDANTVHERASENLVAALNLMPGLGLSADGLGQLVAFGVMVVLAAMLAAVGWAVGGKFGRAVALRYLVLAGFLIFFGVGGDAVHEVVVLFLGKPDFSWFDIALTVVEDGGEMIVASVCAALSVAISQLPRQS